MEFVTNANFKGDLEEALDLQELSQKILNSKLHTKPYQLVIKDEKGTIVLFGNGKFRTMGCIDYFEASSLVCKYLKEAEYHFHTFPFITLQSFSLCSHLGFRINLEKMSSHVLCVYEAELFPALRMKEYKPVCVNVFSTGKVIVCGFKEPNDMYDLMNKLHQQCEPFKI